MINLNAGNNNVFLTLTEKCKLASPNYIIKFVNRTTNAETKIIKLNADDLSLYKNRYNKFLINSSVLPGPGQYVYSVYETSGTSTSSTGDLIEVGILTYHESPITYTTHTKSNQYVAR